MGTVTAFFLGANRGGGFYHLFGQLANAREMYDLMILKGCPGSGKSTFIRRIGESMEAAGADVEYIRCSGDPSSLDGVLLPELRCGIVDGTAPHALEPVYPLAIQRYVDLSRFCDVAAAKSATDEVVRCIGMAAAAEQRAEHALMAAAQVEEGLRKEAAVGLAEERLARRFAGIAARELRRKGGESGKRQSRFLGGATKDGYIWCFESVTALCARVYVLEDRFGLAAGELEKLSSTAVENGWDAIRCLSPSEPSRVEHLLIPGLSLGFVTSREGMRYPGVPFRRIRVDAMVEVKNRGRMRFEQKLAAMLKEEAVEALLEAAGARRHLEEIYRPYVDFDGVEVLAAVEASRLLSWMA